MRRIALYLRQVFCKHEFEHEETQVEYGAPLIFGMKYAGRHIGSAIIVSVTCRKCAYHVSYDKYKES